ncbi:TetR/AcrR family transcriptional regulator [Kribbella sp.]|uniref:TetR/AcrR family transcriptional regulator n=1 Tax=Kribbella sp. TaxID=1871183 RepID=UPI002D68AA2A|nr:TetR/AcrR family transcriptional regulator [Kribbella sp.]HZX08964.1 TetR/AcrR family transcriptional regulator [Kribbella sp.]
MSAGKRRVAAAETRQRLVDAGLRLAERTGLLGLSVNLLVEEAGVSKGTFFHHFGDRSTYVISLHREFHDRLFERIRAAMDGLEPGADRLDVIARTYLDTCLEHRGVRALLLEARADPQIAEEILARNTTSADEVRADFAALGWPDPRQTARLWVGLVAEVALLEHAASKRDPKLRRALTHLTRR